MICPLSVTELTEKMQAIRMLLLDVDGVMTDGAITYHADGSESKSFHVRDGLGLRLLQRAGIKVGVATGRSSPALHHRCRNLNISSVFDGLVDKTTVLALIWEHHQIAPEQIAFAGDDWLDIRLMKQVGLPIAVADAHETVKQAALWVTQASGGRGAVREICDALLKAQGQWAGLLETYA